MVKIQQRNFRNFWVAVVFMVNFLNLICTTACTYTCTHRLRYNYRYEKSVNMLLNFMSRWRQLMPMSDTE